MKKIYLKNLGCPKNEVDGNILLNLLKSEQYEAVSDPELADILIVNSCGFIDAAKEESIDEILALAEIKKKKDVKLVLAGCLAQRYKEKIEKEMPEVDLVVGISNLLTAKDKIIGLSSSLPSNNDFELKSQYKEYPIMQEIDQKPYAYLKISDGCDNFCAYCAIPLIRGRYRSREMPYIISEAQHLAEQGKREIILVAQDITQYGSDIYRTRCLEKVLSKLEAIDGIKWIRLLYTHPAHYTDSLIDYLSDSEKVLPYLDLPLQHISDKLLKSMNRKVTSWQIKELVDKLRNKIDNLAIRTTYIIGFPGESENDSQELWNFQNEYKIERVGVFPYSKEEDTSAYKMRPEVAQEAVTERIDSLMTLVMDQSLERNSTLLGKNIEVLIDDCLKDGYCIARCYDQTPEVDGYVRIKGDLKVGQFVNLRVTGYEAYDLEAEESKE